MAKPQRAFGAEQTQAGGFHIGLNGRLHASHRNVPQQHSLFHGCSADGQYLEGVTPNFRRKRNIDDDLYAAVDRFAEEIKNKV